MSSTRLRKHIMIFSHKIIWLYHHIPQLKFIHDLTYYSIIHLFSSVFETIDIALEPLAEFREIIQSFG